jgi:trehalose utilization protein
MASGPINVLVWDENPKHAPKEVYPRNIRGAVADGLRDLGGAKVSVVEANLDEPDQGITEDRLSTADVLLWWGHARHGEVKQEVADAVKKHVHERGLGLIVLHSGHYSKVFKTVLDSTGHLFGGWREGYFDAEPEEITVCAPKHPIAAGVDDFVLPSEEMYGAPFGAPSPEVVVFQSYFPANGEYFPSFALTVGKGLNEERTSPNRKPTDEGFEGIGRVFYFRPGHETFPTYFNPNIQRILWNAVQWAAHRS